MSGFELIQELKSLECELPFSPDFVYSKRFFTSLAKYNMALSTVDMARVGDLVVGKPRFEHDVYRAQFSSREDPAIILEHGANFCSILIGIDEPGSIASVHKPLIGYDAKKVESLLADTGFMEIVNSGLAVNRQFFLTATGERATNEEREALCRQLSTIFNQDINYLFVNKSPQNPVPAHRINEVFILPSYTNSTGSHQLVLPSHADSLQSIWADESQFDRIIRELESKLSIS